MTTAQDVIYGVSDEQTIPLAQDNYYAPPQRKGCCSRTVKIIVAVVVLLVVGLGGAGLYFYFKKIAGCGTKKSMSVKHIVSASTAN
jgi:hypothetical protein